MPIRMEQDQQDPKKNQPYDPNVDPQPKPKKKFSLLWVFLALFALIKKPKWFIPILLIAAVYFFFKSSFSGFTDGGNYEYSAESEQFSFGAELNEQEYDKAYVFEPLAVGSSNLPSRASMEQYTPRVLHQGSQGSCSGWAGAYAGRTTVDCQAMLCVWLDMMTR